MPTSHSPSGFLRFKDRQVSFARSPIVVGILNVTPDSFSDGGEFTDVRTAVVHAHAMVVAGAQIVDVGGESTRPGSEPVPVSLEMERVLPVIEALAQGGFGYRPLDAPISIDTRWAKVAEEALQAGASMVNDVTAAHDPAMVDVLRRHDDVPVVLMHMLGEPKTMQIEPKYENVVREVSDYLDARARALIEGGVARERIVIDPGLGFGKRFQDNIALVSNLPELRKLGYPVLVGASRKSFLGTLLDGAPAGERLAGSLAVAAHCHRTGVDMIRVHDVRETVHLFRVLEAIAAD